MELNIPLWGQQDALKNPTLSSNSRSSSGSQISLLASAPAPAFDGRGRASQSHPFLFDCSYHIHQDETGFRSTVLAGIPASDCFVIEQREKWFYCLEVGHTQRDVVRIEVHSTHNAICEDECACAGRSVEYSFLL